MTNRTILGVTSVLDIATVVLNAASVALSGSSSGPVNRVMLAPGAEVAWDECECGLLALAVPRVYNSRGTLFTDAGDTYENCQAPMRVAQMTLTVARCIPVTSPDDVTSAPTPDQMISAFAVQEEDAFLVWQAVQCALNTAEQTSQIAAQILNDRTSFGPLGGCVGTQLGFKVGWWRECDCASA